eukprot:95396-Pyramimonas_sp.AAC.1
MGPRNAVPKPYALNSQSPRCASTHPPRVLVAVYERQGFSEMLEHRFNDKPCPDPQRISHPKPEDPFLETPGAPGNAWERLGAPGS